MPGNDFENYKNKGYEYLDTATQSTQGINPESAFKEDTKTTQGDVALLTTEIKTSESLSDAIGTELHLKVLVITADGLAIGSVVPKAINHINDDSESIYLKRIENVIEPIGVTGSTIAAITGLHAIGAIGVAFFKVLANGSRYYALTAEMFSKKELFRDYQALCIDDLVRMINQIAGHNAVKETANKQLLNELLGIIRNEFAGHPYRFDYNDGEKILTLAEIFEHKTQALRSLNNQEINTALVNCRKIVSQREKQIHAFNQIANKIDTHRGDVLTDIIDTVIFGVVPVIPIVVSYFGLPIALAPGFVAAAPIVLTVFAGNAVLTVGGQLDNLIEREASRLWRFIHSDKAGKFDTWLKGASYFALAALGLIRSVTMPLKFVSALYLEPHQTISTMIYGLTNWYNKSSSKSWQRYVLKPAGLILGGIFGVVSVVLASALWLPRVGYDLVNTLAKSVYDIVQTGLVAIKDGLRALGSSDTPREPIAKKFKRCFQRVSERFTSVWNNIIKAPFTGSLRSQQAKADVKANKTTLWDMASDIWYGKKSKLRTEFDTRLAKTIQSHETNHQSSVGSVVFKEQLARIKQYHVHITSTNRSKQADVAAAITGILVDPKNCNKLLMLHKLEFNEMDKTDKEISEYRSGFGKKVRHAFSHNDDTRHAIKYEKWAKSELNSCFEQAFETVLEHVTCDNVLEVLAFKFNIITQQLVKEQADDENRLDMPLQARPEITGAPDNVDKEYHSKFSQLIYSSRSKLIALKKSYDAISAFRDPIGDDTGLENAIKHIQALNSLCDRQEVASSTLETGETVKMIGYAINYMENKVSDYLIRHKKDEMIKFFMEKGSGWDLHQEAKKRGVGIESCKAILMQGYDVLLAATSKKPIDRDGLAHLLATCLTNPHETSSENLQRYLKIPFDIRQQIFLNCLKNGVEMFPLNTLSADSRQDVLLKREAINQAVITNNLSIVELHHIITDDNGIKYRAFVADAYNALSKEQLIINLKASLQEHKSDLDILSPVMQFFQLSKEQKFELVLESHLRRRVDLIQDVNAQVILATLKEFHERDVTFSAEEVQDLIHRYAVAINPNERRELNALASMNTNSRGITTMYDGLMHQRKRAGIEDSIEDDPDVSDTESASPKNLRP